MIPISLIFPGQGAQYVGMGEAFYNESAEAKAVFDEADEIVPHLKEVVFKGPEDKLRETCFCQPGIFTYSTAALKAFQAHPQYQKVTPQFACGLSLGEYSALCAAGALSFEETIRLVQVRGALMDEACRKKAGKMAAVIGFDRQELVNICQETGAEVANFNSLEQIVITGEAQRVDAAMEQIQNAGAKRVIPLDVSGAFHSSLMQPAADQFEKKLQDISFSKPQFPILSNVDAVAESDPEKIRANLTKQITSSVQWVDSITAIAQAGVTHFIEIGPGNVLKGLIRKIDRGLTVHNIQKPEDIDKLPF